MYLHPLQWCSRSRITAAIGASRGILPPVGEQGPPPTLQVQMGRDVSSSSRRVSGQSKPSPVHHRDTGNGPDFISHHPASLAAFRCSALSYSPGKKAVDGVSLGLSPRKNPG